MCFIQFTSVLKIKNMLSLASLPVNIISKPLKANLLFVRLSVLFLALNLTSDDICLFKSVWMFLVFVTTHTLLHSHIACLVCLNAFVFETLIPLLHIVLLCSVYLYIIIFN